MHYRPELSHKEKYTAQEEILKNKKVFQEIEKTNKFALLGYDQKPKVDSSILRSTIRAIRESDKQNEVYISQSDLKKSRQSQQVGDMFERFDRNSFGVSEPKTPDLAPPLHYRERNRELPSREDTKHFDQNEEGFIDNSNRSEPKSSTRKLESSNDQIGSGGDYIRLRNAEDGGSRDSHDERSGRSAKLRTHRVSTNSRIQDLKQIKRFQDSELTEIQSEQQNQQQADYMKNYEPLPPHSGLNASHEDVMIAQKGRSAKDNFLLMLKVNGADKSIVAPLQQLLDNPYLERISVHFGLLGYANHTATEVFGSLGMAAIAKKTSCRREDGPVREPARLPKNLSSNINNNGNKKDNGYPTLLGVTGEDFYTDKYDTNKLLTRANYLRNVVGKRRMTKTEGPAASFRKIFLDSFRSRRGPINAANARYFGRLIPANDDNEEKKPQPQIAYYQSFKFKMLSKENLRFIKSVVKHLIIDNYFSLECENACNNLGEIQPERLSFLNVYNYPVPLEKDQRNKFLRESLINHLTKKPAKGSLLSNLLKIKTKEDTNEPILHTSGDGLGGSHSKLAWVSKFRLAAFEMQQVDFDRRSSNLFTERYLGINMQPEYEGEFKKVKNQSFTTKYYRVICCKLFWYSSVKDFKALGYVDLINCRATLEERNGRDYLSLYPRSDKKELLIILDELGESLRENIVEVRAFYNANVLIETRVATIAARSDITFVSPVKFHLEYRSKYSDRPAPKWCVRYPGLKYFNSLMQIKLVSVNITTNILKDLQDLIIKCVSLKVLELDNNSMTQSVSQTLFRCVSEWAVDKVKILSIRNNKLSAEVSRNLLYYIGLRVCYTLEQNSTTDKRYVSYGPLEMLAISNCGLQDSAIMDLKPILVQYKQRCFLKLDLSGNLFSDRGLGALGDALKRSRVISHLSIKDNQGLTELGLKEFLQEIRYNTSIQELDMRSLPFPGLAEAALKFLRFNQAIHKLKLDFSEPDLLKIDLPKYAAQLGGFRFSLTDQYNRLIEVDQEESLDEEAFWNIFSLVQKVLPEASYQREQELQALQLDDLVLDPVSLIQAVRKASPRSHQEPNDI